MSNAKSIATLAVNDQIRYGLTQTTTVVAADEQTVTIANPDAGRVFGNRNGSPSTITYKRSSKRLAALANLPVA